MSVWAAGISAVAAIGGGLLSSSSAKKAAKKQQKAEQAALAEQARQYDTTRQDQAPWREAGTNALARLANNAVSFGKVPTAAEVMAQPGYQFGLNTGLDALEGRAAAGGGLYSGAAGKALTRYGNDYATTKYGEAFNQKRLAEDDIWNRDAGLAGIGQKATNQLQSAGQTYATNTGNILMNGANAQGASAIAQGNIWGNALNQVGSAANTAFSNGGWWNTPSTGGFIGIGNNGQFRDEKADGGPVIKKYATGGSVFDNAQLPQMNAGWAPAMGDGGGDIAPEPYAPNYGKGQMIAPPTGKNMAALSYAPPTRVDGVPMGLTGVDKAPMVAPPTGKMPMAQDFGPQVAASRYTPRFGYRNRLQAFADGGRVEPRIGSRSPLPQGGGGGGLSRNALLTLVSAQPRDAVPMLDIFNPAAVLAAQEASVSGPIAGPGGPREDLIPAMLSNGEHVFDTEAVNAMGGGSNKRGQAKLNKLRAILKGAD